MHEVGHVLGFMSEVDTVDLYAPLGFPTRVVREEVEQVEPHDDGMSWLRAVTTLSLR